MAIAADGPPQGTSRISELSVEEQVALIEGLKEGAEQAGKPRRKKTAKRQAASLQSSDAQPQEEARCGPSTEGGSAYAGVVAESPRTNLNEASGRGNSVHGAEGAAEVTAPPPSRDPQAPEEVAVSAAASDDDDDDDESMPDSFHCPITTDVMRDPVTALDGRTYERAAIEAWFELKGPISPCKNLPLPSDLLIPSVAFKAAIEEVNEMLRSSGRCK